MTLATFALGILIGAGAVLVGQHIRFLWSWRRLEKAIEREAIWLETQEENRRWWQDELKQDSERPRFWAGRGGDA